MRFLYSDPYYSLRMAMEQLANQQPVGKPKGRAK